MCGLWAEWVARRLITIYDCKVVLNWAGTASDGTVVEGKLTVPEVSHEITLDGLSEYAVRLLNIHAMRSSGLQLTETV